MATAILRALHRRPAPWGPAAAPWRSAGAVRPYAVLLFGTDQISAAFLEYLWRHRDTRADNGSAVITAMEVVTPPDQWVDRGRKRFSRSPAKERALALGLATHDAPPGHRMEGFHVPRQPNGQSFDLAVVVSFGYFLTTEVLQAFKLGAYNFHPSLLPKYRGAAPLQHALINGDSVTGMTVLEISPRAWDAGRILQQRELPIPDRADFAMLSAMVQEQGPPMMLDALVHLDRQLAAARPQAPGQATHARKITTATAKVDFMAQTAADIARLHRAIRHHGKELLLHELDEAAGPPPAALPHESVPPGTAFVDTRSKQLVVACAGSTWLVVSALQLQDRKAHAAWDFVNGYRLPKTGVAMFLGAVTNAPGRH